MKSYRISLWRFAACMGIVMTCLVAWWFGGANGGRPDTSAAVSQAEPSPARASVGQESREKVVLPLRAVSSEMPVVAVSLNAFQERLLKGAVMLEKRQIPARDKEPARELRLWRTDFKYPLVREEAWLARDVQGNMQPVRRDFAVADHAMVKFPAKTSAKEISDWTKRHGFTVRHQLKTTDVKLIAVEHGTLDSSDRIMSAFRSAYPQVASDAAVAERDYLVFPTLVPDDASFSQLWGLHNTGQTGGTADADIDAPEAWDLSIGSRQVLVGVIDTGVDRTHPDLVANMWRNPKEIAGNRVDDDGNGFVDDVNGWDFFEGDNDPMDENNHGTHCSGTIGGVGNNASGVTGVCWQVSIVGIRFLGASGGSTSDAIDCVNYATRLGVDLTSNSWGGGGFSSLLQTAIADAGRADQLFIAAAGNDAINTDLSPHYPAGYAVDTIVSVAASTDRDARSSFSNYGRQSVDLAAPGSSIYSTIRGGSYASFSGTSMATPHVAGAVALLRSIAPTMSARDMKTQLIATVDPLATFANITQSGGRLNLARLIEQSAGPRPVVTVTEIQEQPGGNGDGIYNPGELLALRFSVNNRGSEVASQLVASLASRSANSRFTISRGTVDLGALEVGQSASSPIPFLVKAGADTPTPYVEEFIITLRYGADRQQTTYALTLYLYTSSRIGGRVTDAETNTAISGATVTLEGPSTKVVFSDVDGSYETILPDGRYSASAKAPGYVASSASALTTPPGQSALNFALGIPRLVLSPAEVQADVFVGRKVIRTIEMRNPGTAPLVWDLLLRNGHQGSDLELQQFTLSGKTMVKSEDPENLGGASLKSLGSVEMPMLAAALGTLTNSTIGVMDTSWDRSIFIADLKSRGAEIVTLSLPFTRDALAAIDSIIVDDALTDFTDADVSLLRQRVVAGAGLLCEADNAESMLNLNTLLTGTGIRASANGFRDLTLTGIHAHEMTRGVSILRTYAVGASAALSGSAKALVDDPEGGAHAAVSALGSGVVVFVGNEVTASNNFSSGDGRLFANQIVDGLIGRPSWVVATPVSGVIPTGGTAIFNLTISGENQVAGDYIATAIFATNIPDSRGMNLHVDARVVDAAQISVSKPTLDFGTVVEGVEARETFLIRNLGSTRLTVNAMSLQGVDSAAYSLNAPTTFQLSAGASQMVEVIYRADSAVRGHVAEIVIESDDPTDPTVRVPIQGQRQLPPDIALKQALFFIKLNQGQKGSLQFTLENTGAGPLNWQARLSDASLTVGSEPLWARLPGVSGRYNPNSKGRINIDFDTGLLPSGDYTTTLQITSQDVDTPILKRTVTMRVMPVPRPIFSKLQNVPDTVIGTRRTFSVSIENRGDAAFVLRPGFNFSSTFICQSPLPFTVPGRSVRELFVEFRPTRKGCFNGTIVFAANTAEKLAFISFQGCGIIRPTLKLSPSAFTINSAPGQQHLRSITITNAGDLPLDWTVKELQNPWLRLQSMAGRLNGGQTTVRNFQIDTTNLMAGSYAADVLLTSSDPARSSAKIPVRLKVSRGAVLVLNPKIVRFNEVWIGRAEQRQVSCFNAGNAPMDLFEISSSNSRTGSSSIFPQQLLPGETRELDVFYNHTAEGDFADLLLLKTSALTQKVVSLPISARVVSSPALAVTPVSIDTTQLPGELISQDLTLTNSGGAELEWDASIRDMTGPPLEIRDVLENFLINPTAFTAVIPAPYSFTDGTSGGSIPSGGLETFMNGNILATNLASASSLLYSDGVVRQNVAVGVGGSYFTKKAGPLFVFVGDLVGATSFMVRGGLGVSDVGIVEGNAFTLTVAGVSYRGFLKQVSGRSKPTVNHLIVVADHPGLAHRFPNDPRSDEHEVTGLVAKTRLYHFLFTNTAARKSSLSEVKLLMDTFLRQAVHPTKAVWLATATSSGKVAPRTAQKLGLQMDSRSVPGGVYSGNVRFLTNSLSRSQVDVPVTLRVPSSPRLRITPNPLVYTDTFLDTTADLPVTLHNQGNLPLTITEVRSSDRAFILEGPNTPLVLEPKATVSARLRFSPTEVRDYSATMTFASNATDAAENIIPITARGVRGPQIGVTPNPTSVSVDPGLMTPQVLTLQNTGGAVLQWSAALSSNLSSFCALSRMTGSTAPDASSAIQLNISPTSTQPPGEISGNISFTTNVVGSSNYSVPVLITVRSKPKLFVTPSSLAFNSTFVGASSTTQVTLRNSGNAVLNITDLSTTDSRFSWPIPNGALSLGVNASMIRMLAFTPDAAGKFTGEIGFQTNQPDEPRVALPVSGVGILPPSIRVLPASLTESLEKSQKSSRALTISNVGGSSLAWEASITDSTAVIGTLQNVLQRFNAQHSTLTNLLPNLYSFTEGETGTNINDGGSDMYDLGNYLNTNFGIALPYSNNAVLASASLGAGGRYFTRKQPGLFLFVGDMVGVSQFYISGGLGADGYGAISEAVIRRTVNGIAYVGFLKSVHGTSDPSVNHLIIVEDNPALAHTYSDDTNNDLHTVTGLSGNTRLYYMLVAQNNGLEVGETLAGELMGTFLQNVALPSGVPWLVVSPSTGNTAANNSSIVSVKFDATSLPVATQTATLRFKSNDPALPALDVPVSLEVTEANVTILPTSVEAWQIARHGSMKNDLIITPREGSSQPWTARSTVSWITLSKTSGTAAETLTLTYASTLNVGSYSGTVEITSGGVIRSVSVALMVREPQFTQLLTDYRLPRVLGIIRGVGNQPSVLAALNSSTLETQSLLLLPADITDADMTTDGRLLYAISFANRTISEVDLESFLLSSTKTIPTPYDVGRTAPYHYHVEAGRPGIVYYTDAGFNPVLHVFDFVAGVDRSTFTLRTGAGIGDFTVTPDGGTIYAWSQSSWLTSGSSAMARISCGSNVLTEVSLSAVVLNQNPLEAGVFYSARRDAIFAKDRRFSPDLLNADSSPVSLVLAASAYGDVIASSTTVINGKTGALIGSLAGGTTVAAFSGDQTALIYLRASPMQLVRLPVADLAPATITPLLTDASTLPAAPSALAWTGSPLSASYDVYLGTDPDVVDAATNRWTTIYKGNTQGLSFSFPSTSFQLGGTYYWRIDTRNFDGSTVKGRVWSFRTPVIAVSPTSLIVSGRRGGASVQVTLSIAAENTTTAWTLNETAPWLSVDLSSGLGPKVVTLSCSPFGLTLAAYTTAVTLTSGASVITVPVNFRLLGELNLIKMETDPTLPVIYALHRDTAAPGESWLLWINAFTAEIESTLFIGNGARDFIVHRGDTRLHALTEGGTKVITLHREKGSQISGEWTLPTAAASIHSGPTGRLVARSTSNVLQMYHTVTGGLIGSAIALPACVTASSGSQLLAAVQQSPGVTGIARYLLGSAGISFHSASYWNGTLSPAFVLSGGGTHVFYQGKAYLTNSLTQAVDFGTPIHAASWTGKTAFSTNQSFTVVSPTRVLRVLPFATTVMASTANNQSMVLFHPINRTLRAFDPGALFSTPAALDLGQILVGDFGVAAVSVTNLSGYDIELSATSNRAAITCTSDVVTINAGQSADLAIRSNPTAVGAISGTVTLSVAGFPTLSSSVAVTARGVTEITAFLIDFSAGAPAAGAQSSTILYTEDGLSFSTPNQLLRVGANGSERPNNGTPHIAPLTLQSPLNIRRVDGGVFSLRSVDLAEYSTVFSTPKDITFTGLKNTGATVTTTFTVDGIIDGTGPLADFQTFIFPASFQGLVSAKVTTDLYALDNLSFERVSEISSVNSVANIDSAVATQFDLDHDGMADLRSYPSPLKAGSAVVQSVSYFLDRQISESAVSLQASRDGQNWTTLTPILDYTSVRTPAASTDGLRDSIQLTIPSSSDVLWQFRLIGIPEER